MSRPRRKTVNKQELTDAFVTAVKAGKQPEMIWDKHCPGLALSVRPTGKKAWKVVTDLAAVHGGCTSATPRRSGSLMPGD